MTYFKYAFYLQVFQRPKAPLKGQLGFRRHRNTCAKWGRWGSAFWLGFITRVQSCFFVIIKIFSNFYMRRFSVEKFENFILMHFCKRIFRSLRGFNPDCVRWLWSCGVGLDACLFIPFSFQCASGWIRRVFVHGERCFSVLSDCYWY